ncbi:hypothetical protein CBM2589_A90349 [Cupriavidus taiwanensis]|uniref:Uncharacterized protein n=1 Tax=Cupriavidus taiwanensis TaxID=164546 RepID=A0A975XFY5_9BURK|nr:hypothetical protein CBM2589_A90349 [Cupriavidus taiwanensis]
MATGDWFIVDEFVDVVRARHPALRVQAMHLPEGGLAAFPHQRSAPSDVRGARESLDFTAQYLLADSVRAFRRERSTARPGRRELSRGARNSRRPAEPRPAILLGHRGGRHGVHGARSGAARRLHRNRQHRSPGTSHLREPAARSGSSRAWHGRRRAGADLSDRSGRRPRRR